MEEILKDNQKNSWVVMQTLVFYSNQSAEIPCSVYLPQRSTVSKHINHYWTDWGEQGPPDQPLSMIIIIKASHRNSFQHRVRVGFLPATSSLLLSHLIASLGPSVLALFRSFAFLILGTPGKPILITATGSTKLRTSSLSHIYWSYLSFLTFIMLPFSMGDSMVSLLETRV